MSHEKIEKGATVTTKVLLKTALVELKSTEANLFAKAYALLDEGSQRTFISRKVASEIGCVPVRQESLSIATFGANASTSKQFDVVNLKLQTKQGDIKLNAIVIDSDLTTALPIQPKKQDLIHYDYLQDLVLAPQGDQSAVKIDILIGADHYWDIVQDRIVRGSGPTAVQSKLGYLLSGPIQSSSDVSSCLVIGAFKCAVSTPQSDEDLNSSIQQFWSLESIGINEPEQENSDFLSEYCHSISFKHGARA